MHFRLTQPSDFLIARDFIPPAYRYSQQVHEAIPELWSSLLKTGQLTSAVLEEGSNGSARVLGVGLSVFVSDDFADSTLSSPAPYLNNRLHEMLLAGDSPLLSLRQIALANQNGGLNLLPLHFCTASVDIGDPDVLRTLSAAQDLFRIMHGGYRVKRVLKEVVNQNLCRFMQSTGMNLECDFVQAQPHLGLENLPASERPYLLSANYCEMPLGSQMSLMFFTSPVRFHFSPAEQKLLMCAMLRESEDDIARDLGLSPDTLRKQWKSIFHRVIAADPEFFPTESSGKLDEGVRGRGKRRQLLRYLQMHMEELRPHLQTTQRS